ncbi:MAG: hypothetical protein ACFB20_12915 [Opitutales bacterium]
MRQCLCIVRFGRFQERSPNVKRLKAVAQAQRAGALCVLASLVAQLVFALVIQTTSLGALEVFIMGNALVGIVAGFASLRIEDQLRFARGIIQHTPDGTWVTAAKLCPVIGLVYLYYLCKEARLYLVEHGVEVGLLGASMAQFTTRAIKEVKG